MRQMRANQWVAFDPGESGAPHDCKRSSPGRPSSHSRPHGPGFGQIEVPHVDLPGLTESHRPLPAAKAPTRGTTGIRPAQRPSLLWLYIIMIALVLFWLNS